MLELDSNQRFAEPVALSSTQPADRPLPRRALRLSLDLVALRARRTEEPKRLRCLGQVARATFRSICAATARRLVRITAPGANGAITKGRYGHTPMRGLLLLGLAPAVAAAQAASAVRSVEHDLASHRSLTSGA